MKKIIKEEGLKGIESNKKKLKEKEIIKIGIFGSALKGKSNRKSDIDLLVRFEEETFDNYAELLILLEKLFKKKIDLTTESALRPELAYVKKEAEYLTI